jgi:hypothetical protein
VTDTEKAYYAHTGGCSGRNAKGQFTAKRKRPFYKVDAEDGKAVAELCQENVNRLINETNQANGY